MLCLVKVLPRLWYTRGRHFISFTTPAQPCNVSLSATIICRLRHLYDRPMNVTRLTQETPRFLTSSVSTSNETQSSLERHVTNYGQIMPFLFRRSDATFDANDDFIHGYTYVSHDYRRYFVSRAFAWTNGIVMRRRRHRPSFVRRNKGRTSTSVKSLVSRKK